MNTTPYYKHYSWLLVCVVGLGLSLGLFRNFQNIDQRAINQEITRSSLVKLHTIRTMLQQHLEITQAYIFFVRGELKADGFIEKDEAKAFTRGILAAHPGELQSVLLLPPPKMGAAIMMQHNGSVSTISQADINLPQMKKSGDSMVLLLDHDVLRMVVAGSVDRASMAYVVCDWDLETLMKHAIGATPTAGLNVWMVMETANKPVSVFHHRPRVADWESADAYAWQGSFNIRNARFTLYTQAMPTLISRFSGDYNIWALMAGLLITALLSLFVYNRIRANVLLNTNVEKRTRELSGERAKLAAVIDHAHDGILVVDEQGRILRSNPAADVMFGYSGQAWNELTVHDLVPNELRVQHKQWFAAEVDGATQRMIGKARELEGQRKNGSRFSCETAVHAFTTGGERQFSVILRDVSEFKQRQWVQQTFLHLRAVSQGQSSLHTRLKEMLLDMLSCPWPVAVAAIYVVQGDQLWLKASQGWQVDEKKRHLMMPVGHCLCGASTENPDENPDKNRPDNQSMPCKTMLSKHHCRAICLPLMHEGCQLGLLHLQLKNDNTMPEMFIDFCNNAHEIIEETMARERIRQTLEDSESKHRQLIDSTPVGIVIQTEGVVQYANPASLSMLGADTTDALLRHAMLPLIYLEDRNDFAELMQTLQQGGHIVPTELRLLRFDGSHFWSEIRGVPIIYESKPSVQVLIHDISERKQAEEKLTLISYTDELTELPNRRLYIDRMEQACSMAARRGRQLCLLFLDLDRFKIINDTQGHACGDLVLKIVAGRIQDTLRASDTAARMGGDEFAVLLPETDPASALRVANKLAGILKQPMRLANQEFSIGVSIGLASYPDDGRESDALLNHADSAMYHAKHHHLDVHCFSSEMEQAANRRLLLESELTHAAQRGQLQLHYQMQYSLDDDGDYVGGMESLIRWQHPELGMVSPAEFIPIAEETGLIRPITSWVIGEACRQAKCWRQQGYRPERISINISAAELMQIGLAEDILSDIREAGAEPQWFEIEVTETAAMSQPDTAIAIMQQLVDGGLLVAIDDFGTGYSSLAYLKRLPAHHLKIDIAFIRNLPDDIEDAVIVRTIIVMAHALGLIVVAEGVETEEQLAFLRNEGCDMIQGYLLAKPLPADEATQLLPKVH